MFEKIKNFFRSNKKASTSKNLRTLSTGGTVDNLQKYKNLIPDLIDEFLDSNLKINRTHSFTKKNIKISLSEKKLRHSNSQLFKLRKKIPKKPDTIGSHYFIGSIFKDKNHLTTKNVRSSSIFVKTDTIIREEDETEDINNQNIIVKRSKKKKKTLDPKDTLEANRIQFKISGEKMEMEMEKEINDTKEKLEEYQEKMRKTQLRYYVFKKITNYKSTLRRYFQKYRINVQMMDSLKGPKVDTIKEIDEGTQKQKIKLLKNILKNRTYKEQKELNKYLLRFYYNGKYAAGMANLSKILNKKKKDYNENENKTENKNEEINTNKEDKNEIKNEEIKTNKEDKNKKNNENSNFIAVMKEEIKKEEEKKELSPEEIEKAKRKRNKELRDLFKNKVKERQKWLHDHFVKFYYKGLLWAMKTGNIRNNTSSSNESTASPVVVVENNSTNNNNNSNDNNINNKTSSEIDTININKEIEKKEELKKEEEKKEEEQKKEEDKKEKKKAFNKIRDRSKGLRKLLSEKNKEKTNILRKYFFRFLSNGVLLSLKKTTLQSSKQLSKLIDDPENAADEQAKKEEEEKNNWIIEEKKRKKEEEERKQKELMEKKIKLLFKIFTKKDQIQCGKQRSCLQKWNLRAKIIAIVDLTVGYKKPKKGKSKKKIKKKDKKKEMKKKENNIENENGEKEEDNK